jgi:hypothetical protein
MAAMVTANPARFFHYTPNKAKKPAPKRKPTIGQMTYVQKMFKKIAERRIFLN